MDPGDLMHELVLQELGPATSDGGGGRTAAWVNVPDGEEWGAVEPLEGNERLRAMQTQANATHRVTIRYREGVTAKNRWLHEGRVLKIVSPPMDPEERHVWLKMLCREET